MDYRRRMKCFHAMSRDTSCRPHELLKLRIKDIVFKSVSGNRQYAEVLVNGKTGSRHIPLIDSLPYIKDYIDHSVDVLNGNSSRLKSSKSNTQFCTTKFISTSFLQALRCRIILKISSEPILMCP